MSNPDQSLSPSCGGGASGAGRAGSNNSDEISPSPATELSRPPDTPNSNQQRAVNNGQGPRNFPRSLSSQLSSIPLPFSTGNNPNRYAQYTVSEIVQEALEIVEDGAPDLARNRLDRPHQQQPPRGRRRYNDNDADGPQDDPSTGPRQ